DAHARAMSANAHGRPHTSSKIDDRVITTVDVDLSIFEVLDLEILVEPQSRLVHLLDERGGECWIAARRANDDVVGGSAREGDRTERACEHIGREDDRYVRRISRPLDESAKVVIGWVELEMLRQCELDTCASQSGRLDDRRG